MDAPGVMDEGSESKEKGNLLLNELEVDAPGVVKNISDRLNLFLFGMDELEVDAPGLNVMGKLEAAPISR